eukprot:SAG31_NODE_3596_length_4087_cov_28.925025_2_plen_61_part_00
MLGYDMPTEVRFSRELSITARNSALIWSGPSMGQLMRSQMGPLRRCVIAPAPAKGSWNDV